VCGYCAAVLLGAVIVFQLAVAAGAPWGSFTQGGQTEGALPVNGRFLALVSAVILLVFALAVLARVGRGPLAGSSRRVVAVVAWAAVGYSGLAVLLNGASKSVQERSTWVPVTVVLFVTSLVAVLGSRPKAK
jgi:hypothetical protein